MAKVTDEKAYSIFDTRTTEEIHQEIQQVYLGDSRPWVVGYSGGKDSTTALQLVWYALAANCLLSNAKNRFTSLRLTHWSKRL